MKPKVTYRGRTALITGASAGIGAAFATVVAADLSQLDSPARIRTALSDRGLTVDFLVNNAGFATYGRFENIDPATERDLILVNVAAYVGLVHEFLPEMIDRRDGVIINVSSGAAFQPIPYQVTYAASKAFVQSFSDGLWAENRGTGIRVVSCAPSATDTEYFEVLGGHEEARLGPARPPEGVVAATLRALERGHMYTVVGAPWKVVANVPRFLPRAAYARISERLTRPRVQVKSAK